MSKDLVVAFALKIGGILVAILFALITCFLLEQIHASNYIKASCVSFLGFLCYETADYALLKYRRRHQK